MSKSRNKKIKIFNLFSQNLDWVKEYPSISFKPDFSNGYICPLCFNVFFEKDLDSSLPNYLTLEDIPPKSLGGKPIALTCKTCNSKCGHDLDAHLLKNLLLNDAKMFLPNSKNDVSFELNGNIINGIFKVDKEGKIIFDLQPNRSNPNQAKKFINQIVPKRTFYDPFINREEFFNINNYRTPTFNMKLKENFNEKRAEVALLRIAYLLAFATLGNAFLINGGLFKVREQILNPDKEILPKVFWLNINFPKENEGINIITLPKELQSFLVVFSLKTASRYRQFAIVLPGPSKPSTEIYDYILKELCVGDGTSFCNITVEKIPEAEYLNNKKWTFGSNWYWQEYTSDDYKPNYKPKD